MRILYVEDNARDADLVRRALLRGAFAPELLEVAPDLAAARAALAAPQRFDLVLIDLNLPDGRGLDLVAEIRRRALPLAVVTLTGSGDETLAVAALKAGADDYLGKADDFVERLGATLDTALTVFRADRAHYTQPLRVLYVEHSASDFDLTRRHFRAHAPHIELEWVSDAAAALDRLPCAPVADAPFDLLLLDFRLTGNSGLDVLKTVRRERGLDLPVVLVTGQGSEEVAAVAIRLGATDYVVKRRGYLQSLADVLESAFHRVVAARQHATLSALNASLERKVGERTAELEAAKEAAEAANRGKSAFLARMSHDLRTPLNAVLGFSQLLALDPVLDQSAGARRQLQMIHDAGTHLLAMIDDVLDLARIESGGLRLDPTVIDCARLVGDCLLLVGPLANQHRIKVLQRPVDVALRVHADSTRLRQVLVNLLTNGIKYGHSGGRVDVLLASTGAAVQLAVVDNGRGMTPQQLAGLFQPFNRAGAERSGIEGTGLGLAIALQLVESMGGKLEVHSVPGAGSTFTLTLPAADGQAAAAVERSPAPPGDEPKASVVSRRVLYVEDNPVNQLLMREMLHLAPGVELKVAPDGPAGLMLAAEWRPQLVLLDLDLPGMTGIEMLRLLRRDAATAAIPCAAVSAHASGPEVQHALDEGCVAYLTKPFEMAQLFALVERHAC